MRELLHSLEDIEQKTLELLDEQYADQFKLRSRALYTYHSAIIFQYLF